MSSKKKKTLPPVSSTVHQAYLGTEYKLGKRRIGHDRPGCLQVTPCTQPSAHQNIHAAGLANNESFAVVEIGNLAVTDVEGSRVAA